MSLSITVSASSTDGALTTTAALRTFLGTTSTADDAKQQAQIVAASRWAENVVGSPLILQRYRETVSGFGGQRLMLSRTPVVAVVNIFDTTSTDGAESFTSTEINVEDADAGFLRSVDGFPWSSRFTWDLSPMVAPQSDETPWLIDYAAGYIVNGSSSTSYGTTSTGPTVPADLELAVQMKAAEFIERTGDVSSKTVGDFSITYLSENFQAGKKQDPALELLRPYRRG